MEKGHLLCLRKAVEPTCEACFPFARCVHLSGTKAGLAERGILVCARCVLGECWAWAGCAEVHSQEENAHPLQCGIDLPHSAELPAPASVPT